MGFFFLLQICMKNFPKICSNYATDAIQILSIVFIIGYLFCSIHRVKSKLEFLLKMKQTKICLLLLFFIGQFVSMFTESCSVWQKAEKRLRDLLLERTDFLQNVCICLLLLTCKLCLSFPIILVSLELEQCHPPKLTTHISHRP